MRALADTLVPARRVGMNIVSRTTGEIRPIRKLAPSVRLFWCRLALLIYRQPPPSFRVAGHPFVAEFFASEKPLPAEYKQIAPFVDAGHSHRSSLVPKPAYK
jgi:hypothetical protein